jgi:hypothetical protein
VDRFYSDTFHDWGSRTVHHEQYLLAIGTGG